VYGYAIDDEASESGMRGITAPLCAASGGVVTAVGLVGPVQRLSPELLVNLAPSLIASAAAISLRLGFNQAHVA
jgi:DNA-binding IclR family transcriptional regulator